jgi:predicted aminopeptidase
VGQDNKKRYFQLWATFGLLLLLTGCSSIAYYGQSIAGHSRLMLARQPLENAIEAAMQAQDKELQTQLELASVLRRYAVQALGLPNNASYSTYVALQRDFPVWTVVAAEEFSIEAKTWCYPIVGCAAYRGYFSKKAAQVYAASLRQQGLETTIGGIAAYSTLGWFNDPLLSSMMRYGVADFAETLFHELAHQQLYIKDDSAFNEAFATVVGEQGALRWLSANRSDLLADYQLSLAARVDFSNLLDSLKQDLKKLYASSQTPKEKRVIKRRLFEDIKTKYQNLKTNQWQGFNGFDGWFERPINNARLAAFATYREHTPSLYSLFGSCNGEFERFYLSLEPVESADQKIPIRCRS